MLMKYYLGDQFAFGNSLLYLVCIFEFHDYCVANYFGRKNSQNCAWRRREERRNIAIRYWNHPRSFVARNLFNRHHCCSLAVRFIEVISERPLYFKRIDFRQDVH